MPQNLRPLVDGELILGANGLTLSNKIRIFSEDDIEISTPIQLRLENNENTLLFRFELAGSKIARTSKLCKLAFVLAIRFGCCEDIRFDVEVEIDPGQGVVTFSLTRKMKHPWLVAVNFFAVLVMVATLALWTSSQPDEVVGRPAWLAPRSLNLAIGFVLGFFGLQAGLVRHLLSSWANILSLFEYPELVFSRSVLRLFRSLWALVFFAVGACVLGLILFEFRAASLPKPPAPGLVWVDRNGSERASAHVLAEEIGSYCLVVENFQRGGKENVCLATVRPVPLRGLLGLTGHTARSQVLEQDFTLEEVYDRPGAPRPAPVFKALRLILEDDPADYLAPIDAAPIARWLKGEQRMAGDPEIKLSTDRKTIKVIYSRRHDIDGLRRRLGDLENWVRRTCRPSELDDGSCSVLSQAQGLLRWGNFVEIDDLAIIVGDGFRATIGRGTEDAKRSVAVLEAIVAVAQDLTTGRLTEGGRKYLIESFEMVVKPETASDGTQTLPVNWQLLKTWLRTMKHFQRCVDFETSTSIEEAIERRLVGAEYYLIYLEVCSDLGFLAEESNTARRLREFFFSKRGNIRQREDAFRWLSRIQSRAKTADVAEFIGSLL